jgi:hypothetical protein
LKPKLAAFIFAQPFRKKTFAVLRYCGIAALRYNIGSKKTVNNLVSFTETTKLRTP